MPQLPRKPAKKIKANRINSEKDVEKLRALFKDKLQYEFEVHVDKTHDKIFSILAEAVNKLVDCLWIIIMTHGHNGMLRAFDKKYTDLDVMKVFKGKMREIPKVFVFQASRLGEYATPELPDDDMFAIWSTGKNSSSFRNTQTGSFFINGLTEQLKSLKRKSRIDFEIQHVMKMVYDDCNRNGVAQMPEYESTLTRVLTVGVDIKE